MMVELLNKKGAANQSRDNYISNMMIIKLSKKAMLQNSKEIDQTKVYFMFIS